MRLLLDSNIWRYIVDERAEADLDATATRCGVTIVVAPALIFEARGLRDAELRRRLLAAISNPHWLRLMPEAFLEALEVRDVIRRFRKEWLIARPDLSEVTRLREDWEQVEGGFWSRAKNDIPAQVTDESLRGEIEHELARQESHAIRRRVAEARAVLPPNLDLRLVCGVPPASWPGWRGLPVEYWRIPSLYHLLTELRVFTSPYREWLDSEIDMAAALSARESLTELWLYEISATDAPRQWLRGSFEFLQAFSKVTPGTPADSQISSHLVDVDVVVSADRIFCRFVEKCRSDAPFAVARGHLVPGGKNAIDELFALIETNIAT